MSNNEHAIIPQRRERMVITWLGIALAAALASITAPSRATTIDEIINANRQIQRQEAELKLLQQQGEMNKAMGRPSPQQPMIGRSQAGDGAHLSLIAIYGPSNNPTAEVLHDGAVMLLRKGGEAVQGWTVREITSHRITLERAGAGGKQPRATRTIYLSSPDGGGQPASPQSAANASPNGAGGLPPLPGLPTNR